jgi:hypothetical protein
VDISHRWDHEFCGRCACHLRKPNQIKHYIFTKIKVSGLFK